MSASAKIRHEAPTITSLRRKGGYLASWTEKYHADLVYGPTRQQRRVWKNTSLQAQFFRSSKPDLPHPRLAGNIGNAILFTYLTRARNDLRINL
ncbi:hypothetical protein NPIL_676431 [Nephila pilipes]|uniref:Uncharacterized protein n=1 Tax=Nephila pilipes TaxID=299642 RepID=A0A8X6NGY5_NEPPI|nr:hypothetical protein NPIL_676431 [Nephila pilipes]